MARKYWRMGAYEMYRSLSKKKFVEALQRLVPDLKGEDITPGGAGVRAQAVRADGVLLDDFSIATGPFRPGFFSSMVLRAASTPVPEKCRRRTAWWRWRAPRLRQ